MELSTSLSCVDDVSCVHDGIGYLFPVVPTVVVAVWLRARSLICLWLASSGAMTTRSFLILLVSSVPAAVDAGGLRGYGYLDVAVALDRVP